MAALLLLGCRDPTQIRLDVSTDVVEMDRADARIEFAFGSPIEAETALPTTEHPGPWPADGRIGDLVVVPSDAKNAEIGMRITMALDGNLEACRVDPDSGKALDAANCIIARRRLRFIENETIKLPIVMYDACIGIECQPDTTCFERNCVPSLIDARECVNDQNQCGPGPDAGLGGAGGGPTTSDGSTTTGSGGSTSTGGVGNGGSAGSSGTGGTSTTGTGGSDGTGGSSGGGSGGTAGGGGSGGGGGTGGTGGTDPLGPNVVLSVSPTLGDTGTYFVLDASATTDPDHDAAELEFTWDVGDATAVPSQSEYSHQYAAGGSYDVSVTVTDPDGNSGSATSTVWVSDPATTMTVDTAVDEQDIGATVATPLGTGLSLREAMLLANSYPGMDTIVLGTTPQDPYLLDYSLPLISSPLILMGGAIDASAAITGTCIGISSDDVLISGMEFTDCPGTPIQIQDGVNVEVSDNWFQDSLGAISVEAANARFLNNTLLYEGTVTTALIASAPGVRIQGNLFADYTTGIDLGAGANNAVIVHNTFASLFDSAVVLSGVTGTDFRNNIVFDSGGFGIEASDSAFAVLDYNLYFQNASGDCSACTLGANAVLGSDPSFVDASADDYRLMSTSPAVDAGFDLGIDHNGALSGAFNGEGPDIGYQESN